MVRQNYEAQTPEEALPAWVLTKRRTIEVLYAGDDLQAEYRRRGTPRALRAFANNTLNLYSLVLPKLAKIKQGKDLIKQLGVVKCKDCGVYRKGIANYVAELPDELDSKEWADYHAILTQAVEDIGITRITLATTREGYEMLEGTVH